MSQSFFNFLNRFVTFNSFRHAFGVPPPSKREALFFGNDVYTKRLPLGGGCQRS